MLEKFFVEEAEKIKDSAEILNWYRNLYHTENPNTERGLMARTLNDILPEYVRQKAEIEALINGQETLQKHIAEKMAKIEQLKAEKVKLHTLIPKMLAEAKSEAIKEFAERLKSKFTHSGKSTKYGNFTWDDVTSYELDNLVKEMTDFKEEF